MSALQVGNDARTGKVGPTAKTSAARSRVKGLLPKSALLAVLRLRTRWDLLLEFGSDRRRYRRYCLPGEVGGFPVQPKNLEAQLIKDYHRIEKGLALPQPKRPFGIAVANRIEKNLDPSVSALKSNVVHLAEDAQRALMSWNTEGTISDEIAPVSIAHARGILDADEFFNTRHSVRNFDSSPVREEILEHAVRLALRSPSVCNRQSWLIRFFFGDDVPQILSFQNGNKGFTHSIPVIALVTVDSRMFAAAGERNQPWIEGGIFSMSFVWSLHALGLDSCMLNMSVGNKHASELRKHAGLEDSELVIMMIAIGYGRADHRVARSPRRDLYEVLVANQTCADGRSRDEAR